MRLGNKSEISQKKLKLLNYFQSDQLDSAENSCKTAIRLKPNSAEAYFNLAHTLQKKID